MKIGTKRYPLRRASGERPAQVLKEGQTKAVKLTLYGATTKTTPVTSRKNHKKSKNLNTKQQ